jgi:hypothetical protein
MKVEFDIKTKAGTIERKLSNRWRNIVARCKQDGHDLSKEWHKVSAFMEWAKSNGNLDRINNGMFIDRFWLEGGNTLYHPEKCLLMPRVMVRFADFTHAPPMQGHDYGTGLRLYYREPYKTKQRYAGEFDSRCKLIEAWKEIKIRHLNFFEQEGLIAKTAKPEEAYNGCLKSIKEYE